MTTLNKITEQVRRLYSRTLGSREDVKPIANEKEIKLLVVQVTNELLSIEPKQSVRYADIQIPTCMIATYSDQTVEGLRKANITAITQADPAVVTVDDIGTIVNDSIVRLRFVEGMTEVNDEYFMVKGVSGNTFQLYNEDGDETVDSSAYTAYTSGGSVYLEEAWFVKLPAYPIHLPQDMGVWSVVPEPARPAYIPLTTAAWDLLGDLDEGLVEDQVAFYVEGRKIRFTRQPTDTVTVKLLIVDPALLGDNDPYPVPAELENQIVKSVVAILLGTVAQPEKPKG